MRGLGVVICMLAMMVVGCRSTPKSEVEQKSNNFMGVTVEVSDSVVSGNIGVVDTISVGNMKEGEVIQGLFRIKNMTHKPIVIAGIDSSCGCTTTDYSKKPIDVNETVDITYMFDSKGLMGWQLKLLKVNTSTSNKPIRIYLTAEVR